MSGLDQDVAARLTAAKARRDAAELKLEAARAARRAREATVDADREAALTEALVDAEEKHGALGQKIAVVHATYADGHILGSVIVKVATSPEWSKFRNKISSAKGIEVDHAHESLWRPNVVFPDLATVDRLVAELPFLSTSLADAVGRLCGVRTEDIAGK